MLHNKYPVDRIIFFCDAVFAIAMTLLILEVKLPVYEEVKTLGMDKILRNRIPSLIGFTVSFLVTAIFWKAHLRTCSYLKSADNAFVWLNIWILFFVVLLPFTTAVYSNYGFFDKSAFMLYCLNIAMIGFINYCLLQYVIKKENLQETIESFTLKWVKLRALTVPFIFLLCMALALVLPLISRFGFILIFVVHFIGDRVHSKKIQKHLELKPQQSESTTGTEDIENKENLES